MLELLLLTLKALPSDAVQACLLITILDVQTLLAFVFCLIGLFIESTTLIPLEKRTSQEEHYLMSVIT